MKLAGGPPYGMFPESVGNRLVLYPITKSWKEDEITFAQADNETPWDDHYFMSKMTGDSLFGGDINTDFRVVSSEIMENDTWVSFDVTEIINEMQQNRDSYDGFLFSEGFAKKGDDLGNMDVEHVYDTANSYGQFRYYYASEYEIVDNRPKLTLKGDFVSIESVVKNEKSEFIYWSDEGAITFEVSTQATTYIEVYSLNGRLMRSVSFEDGLKSATLSTFDIGAGIYTVVAYGRTGPMESQKIFIK